MELRLLLLLCCVLPACHCITVGSESSTDWVTVESESFADWTTVASASATTSYETFESQTEVATDLLISTADTATAAASALTSYVTSESLDTGSTVGLDTVQWTKQESTTTTSYETFESQTEVATDLLISTADTATAAASDRPDTAMTWITETNPGRLESTFAWAATSGDGSPTWKLTTEKGRPTSSAEPSTITTTFPTPPTPPPPEVSTQDPSKSPSQGSTEQQQSTLEIFEATTELVAGGACSPFYRPLELTGFTGTFFSPNFPGFYSNDANCQWIIVSNTITGIVKLDFNSLSTEECCDFVILYDGPTTKVTRIATLSGMYPSPPQGFNSTQRYLYVQLITDYSDTASGFNATYTSIARDACSPDFRPAELTGYNGTLTTANYPGNYFNDADCQWRITAVDPKWIVEIIFLDFSTESCCDEVVLYDGDSIKSDRITALHGWYSTPLGPFRSTEKYMFIRFTSDSSHTFSGFSAEYSSVYVPDPCSADSRPANLTGEMGYLLSPNFPADYNNDGDCQWLIASIEPDGFVKLEVTFFSTESCCDTLTLYDGDSIKSPRLASLSGSYSTLPLTYLSAQNYMFVRFTSDSSGTAAGFNATYTSVAAPVTECGSILNVSPNGTAIIPGWGPSCYITPNDTTYVNTPCRDLIQKLPPNIGNYTNLLARGGNFGCGTSIRNDFIGSDFVCLDNYQQTLTLASQPAATKLVVCIRLPTSLKARSKRSLSEA